VTLGPRVLQLVLSLNPGGTERLVVELASRLHSTVPMAICCLDEPGAWAGGLRERGIAVSALVRQSGFRPGLGRAVARAADRHQATVIHAHHYSPFVYGAIARLWRPATRLIFTEHGRLSDAQPSPRRRAVNRLLNFAPQGVFAVSAELKQHMAAEGFPATSITVVHNGIDVGAEPSLADRTRIRQTLGVADDVLTIGTVARRDPVKDLGTLIEGVSHLAPERRVRLVVIGEGVELPRLKQVAAARGISKDVTFLGHRDDARRWLAGFDVFVNSSTSEGVSLTILEAMAAGLPVVATAVGGTPEVVDEASGCLVPARDPIALAAALRSLAKDTGRRASLGQAARRRVESYFTVDRMVADYARVYQSSWRAR
jgi:glycosyltransferase involved in cell wall biosynthesis